MIYCEQYLCIFQCSNKCILEHISHDVHGNCTECQYLDLTDSVLKALKEDSLDRLKESYKNYEADV